MNEFDDDYGDNPGGESPRKRDPGGSCLEYHEGNHEPRQDAVTYCVTDQRHAAKKQEIADQSARGGDQKAHQNNPDGNGKILQPGLHDHSMPVERRNETAHGTLTASRHFRSQQRGKGLRVEAASTACPPIQESVCHADHGWHS